MFALKRLIWIGKWCLWQNKSQCYILNILVQYLKKKTSINLKKRISKKNLLERITSFNVDNLPVVMIDGDYLRWWLHRWRWRRWRYNLNILSVKRLTIISQHRGVNRSNHNFFFVQKQMNSSPGHDKLNFFARYSCSWHL